jgi:hypothetical protein
MYVPVFVGGERALPNRTTGRIYAVEPPWLKELLSCPKASQVTKMGKPRRPGYVLQKGARA